MIVPLERMDEVIAIAKSVVDTVSVGDPRQDVTMGPVVSAVQWDRVQSLIAKGIEEGATLVSGGLGRPDGLGKGYYVKPTVFAHVTNEMTIAREEIFGPVVSILGYSTVDEAVRIANDTDYGLAAYIWGDETENIHEIASQLRAGRVSLNGVAGDILAPFGGYKMSGNGREWGGYGFDEFVEVKAILGYPNDRQPSQDNS
jgi:aldehyde dehydrogenase (NAD+)